VGFPSRTESRLRGATARLQFRAAPFPTGPDYTAQYRLDGSDALKGVLVCKFLEDVSPGGMVHAHVWVHGTEFDPFMFTKGRNFKLMAGDTVIADGSMQTGPPSPTLDPPFLSTGGLPFDL
jgi:hypothetical protein